MDDTTRRTTGRDVTYRPDDEPDKAFSKWLSVLPERYHSLYTHDPEFHAWVQRAGPAWVLWQKRRTKDQPEGGDQ